MTTLREEIRKIMTPLPEVVNPGGWEISAGSAHTDLVNRRMTVPISLSEDTRQIQLREMAHAKWSPPRPEGATEEDDPACLAAAEEVRLTRMLAGRGFQSDHQLIPKEVCNYLIGKGSFRDAATLLASCHGTGDEAEMVRAFSGRFGKEAAKKIRNCLMPLVSSTHKGFCWVCGAKTLNLVLCDSCSMSTFEIPYSYTVAAARNLQEYIRRFEEEDQKQKKDPGKASGPVSIEGKEIASSEEMKAAISAMHGDAGAGYARRWGTMTITEPPRPRKLPPELRSRRKVREDTGSIPIAMHRASIDGRVFRAMRRKRGMGAVLIDQSGSMNLTGAQIMELMRLLPGSIIASYSGIGHEGELRILAKQGKAVAGKDVLIPGGGNIIDGPAVEWLAKQPKPRIWVSDGYITGIGDESASSAMVEGVKNTMRSFDIFRIPNMAQLEKRLKSLR